MARPQGLHDVVVALGSAGTAVAALLTADGLLDVREQPLLEPDAAAAVAGAAVVACLLTSVGALVVRDPTRAVVALASAELLSRTSSAPGPVSWPPLLVVLQLVVPLTLGAAAVRWSRRPSGRWVRLVAAVAAGAAVVWAVGGFLPVSLTLLGGAQATTLVATSVIGARPLLRRVARLARELWASAEVR